MPTSVADARPPGPAVTPAAVPVHRPAPPTGPSRPPSMGLRPAAASTLAPAWLHADPAPARVVAVFGASAAYLLRDGEVLPVLAPGALALPGSLRVAQRADLHSLGLRVGDEVVVGVGQVLARDGGLVVRRTWRPWSAPTGDLAPGMSARALAAVDATPGLTDDLPPDVVRAVREATRAGVKGAWRASGLVGLGPGLTPAGDDVLCGMLLGLRATGREADRGRLERAVSQLLDGTTALSSTLLRQAAAGYAVPVLVDLLHAWHRDAGRAGSTADLADLTSDLADLTAEVAAIGHTSGRALLLGLRAVLVTHLAPAGAARHTHPKRGPS